MTIQRMDNVGIVVESLDAAIAFFTELGLELEGRSTIEGDWAERVTGLHPMRVEIAMMCTPDGHGRLEISRFLTPSTVADHRTAPVNALGYLRIMFAVDDIDETLARLRKHGAELVSREVVRWIEGQLMTSSLRTSHSEAFPEELRHKVRRPPSRSAWRSPGRLRMCCRASEPPSRDDPRS